MDDYLTGRQSLGAFLASHSIGLDEVPEDLLETLSLCDLSYDFIEAWCRFGALFGKSKRAVPILCILLARDDHQGHEELADTLQDLASPDSIDCVYDRANRRLAYLDYNDNCALARRCVWTLHDIGTVEAMARLEALSGDPREVVAREATDRLDALRKRRPNDPKPSYRISRESGLGPL